MMNDILRYFRAPLAWAALLFALSSIPDFDSPIFVAKWNDKYLHVIFYIPLGFLLMRAFTRAKPLARQGRLIALTILIGTAYGVSDEIHQYFVPGRFMDWRDAVADCVGVTIGSFLFFKWQNRSKNSQNENRTLYREEK